VVEFAWDTLILDRLLNGTITVKDVTGSQGWEREAGRAVTTPDEAKPGSKQRVKLELRGNITKLGGQRQVSTTVQVTPLLYDRLDGFRILSKTTDASGYPRIRHVACLEKESERQGPS